MVTDRRTARYDAQALSGVKQQKCLAHVLRYDQPVGGGDPLPLLRASSCFGNRLSHSCSVEAMEFPARHMGLYGEAFGLRPHEAERP